MCRKRWIVKYEEETRSLSDEQYAKLRELDNDPVAAEKLVLELLWSSRS